MLSICVYTEKNCSMNHWTYMQKFMYSIQNTNDANRQKIHSNVWSDWALSGGTAIIVSWVILKVCFILCWYIALL